MLGTDDALRGPNIFLYGVRPSPSWRSDDLPVRRGNGTPVAPVRQPIDLHYLLTFCGDEAAQEPQRLLGVAVTVLAAAPVLSPQVIRAAVTRILAGQPGSYVANTDLADQIEPVRISMEPLSMDELSKLWATFTPAPYRLSVAYRAAVVMLESRLTPQTALPVRRRELDVAPHQLPSVTRVSAASGRDDPILSGTPLRIEGERLSGQVTRVRVGGVTATPAPDRVTNASIEVDLPAGVPAGVLSLQVVHRRLLGEPPAERLGAESNAVPVIVRPAVVKPAGASESSARTSPASMSTHRSPPQRPDHTGPSPCSATGPVTVYALTVMPLLLVPGSRS